MIPISQQSQYIGQHTGTTRVFLHNVKMNTVLPSKQQATKNNVCKPATQKIEHTIGTCQRTQQHVVAYSNINDISSITATSPIAITACTVDAQ